MQYRKDSYLNLSDAQSQLSMTSSTLKRKKENVSEYLASLQYLFLEKVIGSTIILILVISIILERQKFIFFDILFNLTTYDLFLSYKIDSKTLNIASLKSRKVLRISFVPEKPFAKTIAILNLLAKLSLNLLKEK